MNNHECIQFVLQEAPEPPSACSTTGAAPGRSSAPCGSGALYPDEGVWWQVPGEVADVQAMRPSLQALAGWQAAPGTQLLATQAPPLQTWSVPQAVPSGLFCATAQVGSATALAQVVRPVVQAFCGWQAWPATQAAVEHTPPLHAPPSQAVPSGEASAAAQATPASTHTVRPVRVPAHADHRFRSKPITDSGRRRSPIPEQADR